MEEAGVEVIPIRKTRDASNNWDGGWEARLGGEYNEYRLLHTYRRSRETGGWDPSMVLALLVLTGHASRLFTLCSPAVNEQWLCTVCCMLGPQRLIALKTRSCRTHLLRRGSRSMALRWASFVFVGQSTPRGAGQLGGEGGGSGATYPQCGSLLPLTPHD